MILLETLLEYRKGVLFIRIIGDLTKDTYQKLKDDVNKMIKDNQLNNVVLNFQELKKIDIKGVNTILYIYELVSKSKGKIFMCNINEENKKIFKKQRILNYIREIKSELKAFDLVKT